MTRRTVRNEDQVLDCRQSPGHTCTLHLLHLDFIILKFEESDELKGSVEKGQWRFLPKNEHCQNSSKFHMLVCLGVLNMSHLFLKLLDCANTFFLNLRKESFYIEHMFVRYVTL